MTFKQRAHSWPKTLDRAHMMCDEESTTVTEGILVGVLRKGKLGDASMISRPAVR
jgi:hypothetical protein